MFQSFFLGGFESTTGYNRQNRWIDLTASTWHDLHVEQDYRRLKEVGIHAARDAVRWPLVDLGHGRYDFSSVQPMVDAARRHDIDVVWDLFHYGYPDDVDLLSPDFPERFANYCRACTRYLQTQFDRVLWFTPINEPSFFAWAAGHDAQFAPHLTGHTGELKDALVHAILRGIDAIRCVAPDARFLHTDPVCRVAPVDERPESIEAVRDFNERIIFEAWDTICGLRHPELGGSRAHLDVVGINYYWTCQWVHGQDGSWLHDEDPRRRPLSMLVEQVWQRYGGDLMIAETAHWGDRRAGWMRELTAECQRLIAAGVPLRGVCLYPILGMHEWHAPGQWQPMGLWDIDCTNGMCRVLHTPMLRALEDAQALLEPGYAPKRASRQRPARRLVS